MFQQVCEHNLWEWHTKKQMRNTFKRKTDQVTEFALGLNKWFMTCSQFSVKLSMIIGFITKHLGRSDSFSRVLCQHFPDKVFSTIWYQWPWFAFKVNLSFQNGIKYSFFSFCNKNEQNMSLNMRNKTYSRINNTIAKTYQLYFFTSPKWRYTT